MVIAAVAALAGCGGGDPTEPPGTTTAETTPPPAATASPEPTPTPTATPTAEPVPTAAPDEEDAGDEDGNRVPVEFEVLADGIMPRRSEVPAFLGLRITLRNMTSAVHPVRLDGEQIAQLPPGGEAAVDVEGLRPGEHVLEAPASGRATLVAVRAGG